MEKEGMNIEKKDQATWKLDDRKYHEDGSVVNSYDSVITRKYHIEHKYFSLCDAISHDFQAD